MERKRAHTKRFPKRRLAVLLIVLSLTFGYNSLKALGGMVLNITLGRDSLEAGLVAHYTFDGPGMTATTVSDEAGSNNGTISGATADVGTIGQGVSFDGVDDYIDMGIGPTTVNSVSFWVRPSNTTQAILQLSGTANIQISSGTITTSGLTTPTIYVNGAASSTLVAGEWQHVLVTTGTSFSASDIDIGRVSTSYFSGDIDGVRLYSRVLTASEIERLYRLGATAELNVTYVPNVLQAALVGHWSFDANDMDYNAPNAAHQNTDDEPLPPGGDDGGTGPGNSWDVIMVDCDGPEPTDCVDDPERSPTAPSTVDDYILLERNTAITFIPAGIPPDVDLVTAIDVFIYHKEPTVSYFLSVAVDENFGTSSGVIPLTAMTRSTTPTWGSLSASNLSLTGDEGNNLSVFIRCDKDDTTNDFCTIYALYVEITYEYTVPAIDATGAVYDLSSNNNDGTNQSSLIQIGRIGQAMTFDGVEDYIDFPTGPAAVNSVSFWVRPANTTQSIMQLNGTANIGISSGTITTTGFTSPTVYVNGAASSTLVAGEWQHVVVTTGTSIAASDLGIGRVGTSYFSGDIDDMQLYDRVLTAGEVERLSNYAATQVVVP